MLQGSNKARIARRVIEVLEFFDDRHGEATVMDIVRRYDRPQSSTSELLSSLVELGILYKDPQNRSYRPTPRAAMLGAPWDTGAMAAAERGARAVFPVDPADLMPRLQGAALGAALSRLERDWIASDFALTGAELLKRV